MSPRSAPTSKPFPLRSLIRPRVRRLHVYVPGEQPKSRRLIKLNTNENPFAPSPKVLRAVQRAVDDRLRLYPDPTAKPLREALARHHGCRPENIIVGNGSDELLEMATRAFVESQAGGQGHPGAKRRSGGRTRARGVVQYFWPSYSLYPVLCQMHGAQMLPVQLSADFSIPGVDDLRREKHWRFDAALSYITTPNAPSGRGYSQVELEPLCAAQRGVVVLDEAYVDFAPQHALEWAPRYPQVLVSRTFSKAYSLCFQRVGYFVGHPDLISALDRVRDSYNVNGLGQVAALATLSDLGYYRRRFRAIIATRVRVAAALEAMGFRVLPSATNFLLVEPPGRCAEEWFQLLRERHVLVRWFAAPEVRRHLRVTVGTDQEMDRFLDTVRRRLRLKR